MESSNVNALRHDYSRRAALVCGAALLAPASVADVAESATAPEPGSERRQRGLATLAKVTGATGTTVVSSTADLLEDLGAHIVDFAYGDVISRPGIDLRTRELATVAALAALGNAQPQLAVHMRGALNVGATREEILEVVLQTAVYAGFPAALNALTTARQVLAAAE